MDARIRLPSAAWLAAAVCAAIMMWIGAESDQKANSFKFTGQKTDYYSLLVAGFVRGHLYMNVDTDPGLASAEPKIRENTPTLLDADYYNGHFYLYYGVVPAVLLLLPYHLLTGQDLGINVACLFFWLVGFGVSLSWLRSWWKDHKPDAGAILASLAVVVLAFFSATPFLVRRSMFYELPLVAGFACLSVFFAALYQALQGRRTRLMLAVAGSAVGLAVGCHPNHILLLPLLGWAVLARARGSASAANSRPALAAAALLPAAAIGTGLAWYNWARFGSIFEFGFRYGQNGFFAVKQSLFVPRFLWANFKWYFLTPPALSPNFPIVFPGNNTFRPPGYFGAEAMHGEFPATLLFAWILAGCLASNQQGGVSGVPRRFALALGYAAVAAFGFVGLLQIRADRYAVDFETPLAWLLVAWGGWTWIHFGTSLLGRLWKTGFAALVLLGSLVYILGSIQQFEQFRNTRPATYAALSQALDVPYRWFHFAGVSAPGLLVMTVRFSPQKELAIEPLATTGTPGYSDTVYAAQAPNQLVQFRFNHKGYGGPVSAYVPVDLDREHVIEISMGSFFPPASDSTWTSYPAQTVRLLKSLAYLRMDGRVLVSSTMAPYESPPWSRQIGANKTTLAEFERTFSGRIGEVHTVAIEPLIKMLNGTAAAGILRYKVQFPAKAPISGLPLVGAGVQGDGNMVYAKAEGGSVYRIAMDDWGYGALAGEPFHATPGEHDLQIVLGPILARSKLPGPWQRASDLSPLVDRVIVSIDGAILGDFPVRHHLDRIEELTPGRNPQGFSTAEPDFRGEFEAFPITDAEVQTLLEKAVHLSPR
jgi:hypothetical protein